MGRNLFAKPLESNRVVARKEPIMATIKYKEGAGAGNRAAFVCGKASLPLAVFTRIRKELEGKSEAARNRIFYSKLGKKHGEFLLAVENGGITPIEAIQMMVETAPEKKESSSTPRIAKEVGAVGRMLCRKYPKKDPEEMFEAFSKTVNKPEFKTLVVELIEKNLRENSRNKQGYIRVRKEETDPIKIENMKNKAINAQEKRMANIEAKKKK